MDWVYWLWVLNSLLAFAVIGICFVKTTWSHLTQARNARVAGLGLMCTAIAWGSVARRNEEFKPWMLILMIGLVLCLYGMSRIAPGEIDDGST